MALKTSRCWLGRDHQPLDRLGTQVSGGERSQPHLTTPLWVCSLLPNNFQKETRPEFPVAIQREMKSSRRRSDILCVVAFQWLMEQRWCQEKAALSQGQHMPSVAVPHSLLWGDRRKQNLFTEGPANSQNPIRQSLRQARSQKRGGENHIHVPEVKDHH